MKKTVTRDAIMSFADTLSKRPIRRRKTIADKIRRQDLFVPIDRVKDLISLKDACTAGLIVGSIAVLNRKAHAGEIKAIKIPGRRGWQVLPEWLEDFSNGWAKNYREKVRA